MEFPRKAFLEIYLEQRLASGQVGLCQSDQPWIDELYRHHLATQQRIELLSDGILLEHLGFSNVDYNQFTAAIKAFADFSIYLGRAFKLSAESNNGEKAELYMSEYMENVVCTLNYAFFDSTRQLSGLQENKFKALLAYFAQCYEQPEAYHVTSYAACGDGYLPPFELGKKAVVFSPHSIRHLHTFNNILYSINKTRQALFNDHLSSALEPVLINQTEKLFAAFPDLTIRKNINYPGSEIDMMVLSENGKVCLIFQAKATLAPASSRTLSRVQDRSLEGLDQIKKFEDLPLQDKLHIINGSFGTNHSDLKILSLLLVRSSAGSEDVWGSGIPIVNHSFLAGMLYRKLSENDFLFAHFDKQVDKYMEELILISGWTINEEKFEISNLTIIFPDIDLKLIDLIAFNYKYAAKYGDVYFKAP